MNEKVESLFVQVMKEALRNPEFQQIDEKVLETRLEAMLLTGLSNEQIARTYLEQFQALPGGALVHQITSTGKILTAGNGTVEEITQDNPRYRPHIHKFISHGNLAYYFIGNPSTGPDNPENATFKTGITPPHHHFTPHAHGTRHCVFSAQHAGCLLFDKDQQKVRTVKLQPGSIMDIPGMLPHAFYNRTGTNLVELIANGGLGIDHEDYAITREIALQRLQELLPDQSRADLEQLTLALEHLEKDLDVNKPQLDLGDNEKFVRMLFRLAEAIGMSK